MLSYFRDKKAEEWKVERQGQIILCKRLRQELQVKKKFKAIKVN